MNMICKVVLTLLYLIIHMKTSYSIKCYICGIDDMEECENFDPKNSSFIMNCPEQTSCGLQTQGHIKIRTCEVLHLNDCKKANSIEYCYCTRDLCNGLSIYYKPSDDEDDVEGSGTSTLPTQVFTKSNVTEVLKPSNGNQILSTSIFLPCLLSFISSIIE